MREHAVVRVPLVQNRSLIASGMPSSGPASPLAMRASEAFAISAARSGVSRTYALSARAASTALTCAAASSAAENDFLRRPSRASARVSDVSSATAASVLREAAAHQWRRRVRRVADEGRRGKLRRRDLLDQDRAVRLALAPE